MSYTETLVASYKDVRARLRAEPLYIKPKTPPKRSYAPSWSYEGRSKAWREALMPKVQPKASPIELEQPVIPPVKANFIMALVCQHYKIRLVDMISERRQGNIVRPRHVAMYLCREMTTWSYPKIGRKFGGRDHSTVMNACEKMDSLRLVDADLATRLELLKAQILEELA